MKKQPSKKPRYEFPRIYRVITERVRFSLGWASKQLLVGLICVVLALGVGFGGYDLYTVLHTKQVLETKQAGIVSQLSFWEQVTKKYSTYRDAYLQAAVLAYQLGEREKALYYARKGYALDPNNPETLRLLQLLKDKN